MCVVMSSPMYIKVKVVPDSKEETVERLKEDEYRIRVKASAEGGRANQRVLELMRELYPDTRIRIISGHTSPSKIVAVD
jgi:uncharacterized protein (TIGR00251 family)